MNAKLVWPSCPPLQQSKPPANLVGKVTCLLAQSEELPSDVGRVMQLVRSLLGLAEKFLRSSNSSRFFGAMHLHVEFCWPFAEDRVVPEKPAAAWQKVSRSLQPNPTRATPAMAPDTGGRCLWFDIHRKKHAAGGRCRTSELVIIMFNPFPQASRPSDAVVQSVWS